MNARQLLRALQCVGVIKPKDGLSEASALRAICAGCFPQMDLETDEPVRPRQWFRYSRDTHQLGPFDKFVLSTSY